MADNNTSTGATPTGETVLDAANQFESLLSIEDGEGQGGSGKKPEAKAPKGEKAESKTSDEHDNHDESESDDDDLLDEIDGDEKDENDESDAEGDESDKDDPDAEGKGKKPELFTVKVDGKETKVTLAELEAGYSRQADYTRKTQVVAQERTALQAELGQTRQERAQAIAELVQARELMKKLTPQEPDWDALYATDRQAWAEQREIWRSWKDTEARTEATTRELFQKQQQEQQANVVKYLETERAKLFEAVPEWEDPKVFAVAKTQIATYAKALGYTDEELKQVTDHRVLVMVRDAMKYRQLLERKKSLKPDAPRSTVRTSKPGSQGSAPRAKSKSVQATNRLRQTGSVKDAAAAFEARMDDD